MKSKIRETAKRYGLLIIAIVAVIILSSCNSTKDVSSSIPKLCENVMSSGGNGSPNADIQLSISYPEIPPQLAVYRITTNVDDAWALNKARIFGLENNPVPFTGDERMVYSYTDGETVLEISMDGRILLRPHHSLTNMEVSLPTEDECIRIASDWLKLKGLYPDGVKRIEVGVSETIATAEKGGSPTQEIPTKKSITFVTAQNGYDMYTATVRVTIGDQGEVVGLSYNDPETSKYGVVDLKTPDKAYDMLADYLKDPSFTPAEADECMANWRGFQKLIVNSISLQYMIVDNYLIPGYIFEGDVYLANQEYPEHFVGKVDAVQR